jgi:hypothetical protein
MIPAPTLYYKCPGCDKIHANESIISGNTFGSKQYSDTRRITPMLPEFPSNTKCQQCGLIFWLDKTTETRDKNERSRHYANFLSIDGFKEALSLGMGTNGGRALHLRLWLLWSWHEAMEKNSMQPEEVYNDTAYNENITGIQQHINTNELGTELFMAELHRFAGRFEKAAAIFEKHLDNTEHMMIAEGHHRCFEHDRRTYQMN